MKTPFSGTILAFMAGAAAGAALGILFAPDKGENTRKKVKEKLSGLNDKLGDDLNERINNLKKDINQFVEGVSRTLDDIVSKAENEQKSTDPNTTV